VLSTSYKILSSILARLIPFADEIVGDHQCGFWHNRSTTDGICYIQQIMEKKWEYNGTVLMSHNQKIGQKHSIKIVNRCFEDVVKFRYFGTTLTDQNCMHKEIKSRLNLGNACYR
jgi:hypothetical protein